MAYQTRCHHTNYPSQSYKLSPSAVSTSSAPTWTSPITSTSTKQVEPAPVRHQPDLALEPHRRPKGDRTFDPLDDSTFDAGTLSLPGSQRPLLRNSDPIAMSASPHTHRAGAATCSAQRQGAALHIQRALHPAFRHLHRGQPSDASAINRDTGLLFNTLHYCETLFINLRLFDYKTFD